MRALPDVTSDERAETPTTLQWVGMEDIAVPFTMNIQGEGLQTISASANLYVSLEKPEAKGIHMSRLHHVINQLAERVLKKQTLEELLDEMIHSQDQIGQEAKIELIRCTAKETSSLE